MTKKFNPTFFYIILIIIIVGAYLYNKGFFTFIFLEFSKTSNTQNMKAVQNTKKNIIEIEFKDKEYQENYNKYQNSVIELAQFEEEEPWQGEFDIDDINVIDGISSITISSKNGETKTITLRKKVDLSLMKIIRMYIYIPSEEIIDDITNLNIKFNNDGSSLFYEYPILNIKTGWNLIQMDKEKFKLIQNAKGLTPTSVNNTLLFWNNISSFSIDLAARSKAKITLSLDRLWAENGDNYQQMFLTSNNSILSLKKYNNKTYINFTPNGNYFALIKKVTSVKNFDYIAKMIPQRKGAFGINFKTDLNTANGYYLEIGGIDTASWQLYKVGQTANGNPITRLDNGEINNFLFEIGKSVWLKIVTSGNKIGSYISTDGKNFTKLTEKNDNEFGSGGIGIHTNANLLLESIYFKQ